MLRLFSALAVVGDTYPEIKALLDAEKAASAQPIPVGICEIADAPEALGADVVGA